jgi:hypothetical protein
MKTTATGYLILFLTAINSPIAGDTVHQEIQVPASQYASLLPTLSPGGPLTLLTFESVHKELGLAPEQIRKLNELIRESSQAACDLASDFDSRVLYQEGRPEMLHEFRGELERLTKKSRFEIMRVLKPYQRIRYRELLLQTFGWSSLLDAEVMHGMEHTLGLASEQKKALFALSRDFKEKLSERYKMEKGRASEEQKQHNAKAIADEFNERVWELLSEAQRNMLERMTGKPFAVTPSTPASQSLNATKLGTYSCKSAP